MKIAICDNNKILLEHMYKMVCDYKFEEETQIDKFSSGLTLCKKFNKDKPYDIIFMDLCLTDDDAFKESLDPDPDGVETVQEILELYPQSQIIYMSSYSGFFEKISQEQYFVFMPKPISATNLKNTLDKCIKQLKRFKPNDIYFPYTFNGIEYWVNLSRISYIYSYHRKMFLHFYNGEEKYYYEKLDKEMLKIKKLNASTFLRISKSFVVNTVYIEKSKNNRLYIEGQEFKISKEYLKFYKDYMVANNPFGYV